MAERFETKKRRRRSVPFALPCVLIVLALVLMAVSGGFLALEQIPEQTAPQLQQQESTPDSVPQQSMPPENPAVTKVSTATIGSTGDLLLHSKVIKSGYDKATGTYNYDSIFSYFAEFVSAVDYAVANLEVTLCGDDNGYAYTGYPRFNSPDAIVDAAKSAGFDMLLTANNHSFDTGIKGFLRTQEVIKDRNLDYIGTRFEEEDRAYIIKEINGINIGMICYTYNTGVDANGNVSLNSIPLTTQASRLVNSFSYWDLDGFYEKLAGELASMRAEGAEAVMLYIHWGDEYNTKPNATQKKMAQALCDLGIEVIVGNHAHVPQPVELLTNTQDGSKKTLCLYSMGNSISNIRRGPNYPAETEDGMLFSVTFAKYSDGTVLLESADILPTWVDRYEENGVSKFRILTMGDGWEENVEQTVAQLCKESYDRTMKIVGAGLEESNEYFAQNQAETEKQIGVTE